jgi:hypothetical protein
VYKDQGILKNQDPPELMLRKKEIPLLQKILLTE